MSEPLPLGHSFWGCDCHKPGEQLCVHKISDKPYELCLQPRAAHEPAEPPQEHPFVLPSVIGEAWLGTDRCAECGQGRAAHGAPGESVNWGWRAPRPAPEPSADAMELARRIMAGTGVENSDVLWAARLIEAWHYEKRQQWRSRMGLTASSDELLVRAEAAEARAEKAEETIRMATIRLTADQPTREVLLQCIDDLILSEDTAQTRADKLEAALADALVREERLRYAANKMLRWTETLHGHECDACDELREALRQS
jgi:hypothetical protein